MMTFQLCRSAGVLVLSGLVMLSGCAGQRGGVQKPKLSEIQSFHGAREAPRASLAVPGKRVSPRGNRPETPWIKVRDEDRTFDAHFPKAPEMYEGSSSVGGLELLTRVWQSAAGGRSYQLAYQLYPDHSPSAAAGPLFLQHKNECHRPHTRVYTFAVATFDGLDASVCRSIETKTGLAQTSLVIPVPSVRRVFKVVVSAKGIGDGKSAREGSYAARFLKELRIDPTK